MMSSVFSNRVVQFMGLAFVLSWGAWLIAIRNGGEATSAPVLSFVVFGSFGPALAALILSVCRPEPLSPRAAFRTAKLPPLANILFALLLGGAAPVVAVVGPALTDTAGLDLKAAATAVAAAGGPFLFLAAYFLVGPVSEEPGWRGYAYPRLRQRLGALQVALLLSAVWAVWHIPLFLIHGTFQNQQGLLTVNSALFFANCLPLSVIIGFAYEKLGGLLAAIIVHFSFNTFSTVFGLTSTSSALWSTGCEFIIAVLLIYVYRRFYPKKSFSAD